MVQDGFEPAPFHAAGILGTHMVRYVCAHIHACMHTEMMWYSQPFTAPQPGPVMDYAPKGEHGIRMQTGQDSAHRLPGECCAADQLYGVFEMGTLRSKVG